MKVRAPTRSFAYRAGIRVPGTEITCDAAGSASGLVFLSRADALPPRARLALRGRRQLVTTDATLRLLGDTGARLRERTLPATFGQPFNLGAHRLEVVPSGYGPGAAALLGESERRRWLYLGAFCPEPLLAGVEPACLRRADALCIDASLADPELSRPARQDLLAELCAFAETAVRVRGAAVVLTSPGDALAPIAAALTGAGMALRAHRHLALALGRLRLVCPGLPAVPRFAGRNLEGEVLLWPQQARHAPALAVLGELPLALVSGVAAQPAVAAGLAGARAFALSSLPSFAEIVAAALATGAREIALFHGAAEAAATMLRTRGLHAYALGPPRQMSLPAGS